MSLSIIVSSGFVLNDSGQCSIRFRSRLSSKPFSEEGIELGCIDAERRQQRLVGGHTFAKCANDFA